VATVGVKGLKIITIISGCHLSGLLVADKSFTLFVAADVRYFEFVHDLVLPLSVNAR